jgi:predicted metal-dependent phosphoesterase TrpH
VGEESYSEPLEVYAQARRRGMDLVTLTDHDTIAGALEIQSLPGTFVSTEVTCELPGDRKLHLGVWDVSEAQYRRIAELRRDAEALFAYLAEAEIPFGVNHLFSALTGSRHVRDVHLALRVAPCLEARNGMMSRRLNAYAAQAGTEAGLFAVGGSDAHTLASVARAYTVVEGARSRDEFLLGLRRGFTVPAGTSGSYARLTADTARVFAAGYRETFLSCLDGATAAARFAVALAGIPLLPLLPFVTAAIYLHEQAFAARQWREFQAGTRGPSRRPTGPRPWGPAPRPAEQR